MSILPKINVGVNFRKEENNLSQDTHTTAEIGYFQPTFCRNLVARSHVTISAKSLCRLSPLAVPTMGRVSLRHYFFFADLATLWTPFEALKTGNNYTYADGSVQVPYEAPYFSIDQIMNFLFNNSRLSHSLHQIMYCTLYKNGTILSNGTSELNTALTAVLGVLGTSSVTRSILWLPKFYKLNSNSPGRNISVISSTSISTGTTVPSTMGLTSLPLVTNKNSDFAFRAVVGSDTYMFLCKFTPIGKRLRKIFIGSGYSFNPFDEEAVTPFKLFAIYKAWYDKFAVQRSMNFNNTKCYLIMKYLSEIAPTNRTQCNFFESSYTDTIRMAFLDFLFDLTEICYVLPPDYFSASDTSAQRGSYGTEANGGIKLDSPTFLSTVPTNNQTVTSSFQNSPVVNNLTGLGIEMVQKALRFVNKRSVVGRKVSELLHLEGESDTHNNSHEQVHKLGESKVDIQISDVMSLADTSTASLGDYAGRGIGFKDSDTFVYDTPCQGILLCLTAVVPTSGYFQGILKENTDRKRFDFFTEEYDALGYQSIAMNELVSDFQFDKSTGGNPVGTTLGYFGLVPRYQHLRVGRNTCNGDISIPSMQPVMLPYNLDRHFITCMPNSGNTYDFDQVSVPSIYPEVFRDVKADSGYGDYNRIFQYVGNDFDHFIIHMVFDCKILSPLKSCKNAYDTFQEDDSKTLEFKHE